MEFEGEEDAPTLRGEQIAQCSSSKALEYGRATGEVLEAWKRSGTSI